MANRKYGSKKFICSSGSSKSDLQSLAININDLSRLFSIDLEVSWISRRFNASADYISKLVDTDDWEITDEFFELIDGLWGPLNIDRFASYNNTKCERFNSKFYVPGTEAVDAFTQDWRFENNRWIPPANLITRVLRTIISTHGIRGVLIIPYWRSAPFWSLLQNGPIFSSFVVDHMVFKDTAGILKLGNYKYSLLGSPHYRGGIVAILIKS